MEKVAVIGANGQLGSDLVKVLRQQKWPVTPLLHRQIEVKDRRSVSLCLSRIKPNVVINTAAFHDLVACEQRPQEAFEVNALGVGNLAYWCRENQATLVHFSTDYVFGGDEKRRPYQETDPVAPQSVYAISKLAGELLVQTIVPRYFLIRTSGLYGTAGSRVKGSNFVEKRIAQAKLGETIYMVADQILSPTYTMNLAQNVAALLKIKKYGLYHMSS
ncbi:MAG: NAD(P)-dependent oxidoreductase, partial [Candidatus Chisholmbacteria bacterium]|nr:NAD(P)-dependent oxidoreductase [Candidatus Chisholmbacteria bacterium]